MSEGIGVGEGMMFRGFMQMILGFIVWMFISLNLGTCSDNLALHKPAWMSSTFGSHVASNAVDGKKSGAGAFRGIHTYDTSPWLIVDLMGQYYITSITIYNRRNCCQDRLHDFILEVFKMNPTRCPAVQSSVCKNYTGVLAVLEATVECDTPVLGRYVRIWKPATTTNLNFEELEVYGQECTPTPIPMHNGKHVNSNTVTSVHATSRLSCVTECAMYEACAGVNYNTGSAVCELLTRTGPNETVTDDPAWDYYGQHELC